MGAAVAGVVGGKELADTVESMAWDAVGMNADIEMPYREPQSAAQKALKALWKKKDRQAEALRDARQYGNDPDIDARKSCSPVYRRALMIRRLREETDVLGGLLDRLYPDD
jgi:hypothetical protein